MCFEGSWFTKMPLFKWQTHSRQAKGEKKWKKLFLSINLILIGRLSLAVQGREFCVGILHHCFHDIPVAFKQITALSKLLIRHWVFSLLQKCYIRCKAELKSGPGPSRFLSKSALIYTVWFKNKSMQLLLINCNVMDTEKCSSLQETFLLPPSAVLEQSPFSGKTETISWLPGIKYLAILCGEEKA